MWRVRFFKTWLACSLALRLDWVASSSREVTEWLVVLFCPVVAPAGVTVQLLVCLARELLLAACSRESPARSNLETLFFLHILEHFFTLSHSLPLQESHLNTGLLIAKIQANLAQNKANKMVDKIQPYSSDNGCLRFFTFVPHLV